MDKHDLGGRALLVVVRREIGFAKSVGEQGKCRGSQPRPHATDECEKARGIGEIDQRHRRGCTLSGRLECGAFLARSEGYSMPWRSAAAAANGPSTMLASVNALKIVSGVPNGTGPTIAAFDAATPKISTGIVSGRTSTASKSPPRRSATDSAAPMRPMKVSAGVPISKVKATAPLDLGSRLSSNPSSGVAITSGSPVVSQ